MKLGHNKRLALEEEGSHDVPPIRKFRAWQIGVALFVAGNLANFGSFAFAVSLKEPAGRNLAVLCLRQKSTFKLAFGKTSAFVAQCLQAQSILAALGSVQFIANVLFGNLILHEPVRGVFCSSILAVFLP